MNKPKLNKYISFSVSDDKSLLDILDSVEEIKEIRNDIKDIQKKNICKCCNKYITKFLEEHQVKCFQNKIEDIKIEMKLLRENVLHEIRIKGLEILIQKNNEKWKKIYKII